MRLNAGVRVYVITCTLTCIWWDAFLDMFSMTKGQRSTRFLVNPMVVVVFNALGTDVQSSKIKLSSHLNFLLPSVEEELKWKFTGWWFPCLDPCPFLCAAFVVLAKKMTFIFILQRPKLRMYIILIVIKLATAKEVSICSAMGASNSVNFSFTFDFFCHITVCFARLPQNFIFIPF